MNGYKGVDGNKNSDDNFIRYDENLDVKNHENLAI